MKRKNILSLLLVVVMAISLVGCGSKDETVADTNTTEKIEEVESIEDDSQDEVMEAQVGVSGPADEVPAEIVEELVVEEVKSNVITLTSPDGSEIVQEFEIPEGYTVVSDLTSNCIELVDDDKDFVKIEIISGVSPDVLMAWINDGSKEYWEKIGNVMGISIDDYMVDTLYTKTYELYDTKYNNFYHGAIYQNTVDTAFQALCTERNGWDLEWYNEVRDGDYYSIVDFYRTGEMVADDGSRGDEIGIRTMDDRMQRYVSAEKTWTIRVTIHERYEKNGEYYTYDEIVASGEDINNYRVFNWGDAMNIAREIVSQL
uniref:hypothetical protein n=1 Tax=Acetatifactor sp. TaxID=1872090 RepID=UPI004057BDBE